MSVETIQGEFLLGGPLDSMCRRTNVLKRELRIRNDDGLHVYRKTDQVVDGWAVYEYGHSEVERSRMGVPDASLRAQDSRSRRDTSAEG